MREDFFMRLACAIKTHNIQPVPAQSQASDPEVAAALAVLRAKGLI